MEENEHSKPTSPFIERRGMDPAVIALVKHLHEEFIDTHANVHDTFVEAHTREHELGAAAHERALTLAHSKFQGAVDNILTIINERDQRYEERFQAAQMALQEAFVTREKALKAAFDSAEKAIAKAEMSIEKRADATYVSLTELQRNLGRLMPRSEAEQRFGAIEAASTEVRDRLKGLEAVKQGSKEAFSNIQMFMGIIVAIIAIEGFLFAIRGG